MMKVRLLLFLFILESVKVSAQEGDVLEVMQGPVIPLREIPANWQRVDEGPSGPAFTVFDGDSAWLVVSVRPHFFKAYFLLNHWGGDFSSKARWTTEKTEAGDSLWVLHTCEAWSHTRYEEQSATKDLDLIYWKPGKRPELIFQDGGMFESREQGIGMTPEIVGIVLNVKFTRTRMILTRAMWKTDAPSQPQWQEGLWVLSYKRTKKGWVLQSETKVKNTMTREEAIQWLQVPESEICEWWFEMPD